MSFAGDEKKLKCGKGRTVSLQRATSSIFRDLGKPCLHQSHRKINKMLKPDKWQSTFDSDGKILGFQKVLKLIILGGVDPSIRSEVWEFLLGCYALSSTTEYRKQLRTVRRERYRELLKQCQMMHSSVGTGSLAYIVGSKIMDMRTGSKEVKISDTEPQNGQFSEIVSNKSSKKLHTCRDQRSRESFDLVSVRGSSVGEAAYESSGTHDSKHVAESCLDFPDIPLTDLFGKNSKERKSLNRPTHRRLRYGDELMHNFQINNNSDLVVESNSSSNDASKYAKSNSVTGIFNSTKISDAPDTLPASEERVSDWLWTLHRIVVDVVRTDSHLEFYMDTRNLARMSDILAIYAWVDPETGYCQGMSDLLSPFLVLFEDNADAFWCFEMLLRRTRENFKMEGPLGVMKQLQALWHILELTDREIFSHLSQIGAESLHFAFRMLLVLFRREVSFNESLSMWEMIWAADFHFFKITEDTEGASREENRDSQGTVERSISKNKGTRSSKSSLIPFCGLTKKFWSRNDHFDIRTIGYLTGNGDDELTVFCVAAILVINRQKIIRETRSFDDLIKLFNGNTLKIRVKSCVRTAIKLRKKYFHKQVKRNPSAQDSS